MSTLSFNQLAKNSIGDFFHVPSDYNLRIAKYTNLHLREQEGVKTRQIYGNLCSIANGTAFSVPSHGASLVICIFAARRLYVAVHKLRLIKKEVIDRGLELRPFLKRDWMIPVAVSLTATAITWGVDLGLSQLVPMNSLALIPTGTPDNMFGGITYAPSIPGTNSGLGIAAHHFHQATTGFAEGVHNQVSTLLGDGVQAPIDVPFNANDPNFLAQQYGFSHGVSAAQAAEQAMTAQLGAMAMQFTSEKIDFESLRRSNAQSMACRRLPWSTRVVCQECVMPIEYGIFFHSCDGNNSGDEDDDPDDDEYDVCWPCYNGLKNDSFKAQLRPMYFAVPGDSFHPGLNAVTLIDLLGPSTLLCMACDVNITNGWYYDCWDCRSVDKRWTFCQLCYRQGGGCARNKTHRLFAFPRTRIAEFESKTPYQNKGPKGTKETGRASCTKCKANIERGAYFHCAKCDNGDFVLCTRCHASERHCWNSSHVLTKYYAWKYKRDFDAVPSKKWECSNPDCLNLMDVDRDRERCGATGKADEVVSEYMVGVTDSEKKKEKKSLMAFAGITKKEGKKKKKQEDIEVMNKRVKFKYFFSCLEPACQNKKYGLCPACYFTDLTCPVKDHDIYKCYFVK